MYSLWKDYISSSSRCTLTTVLSLPQKSSHISHRKPSDMRDKKCFKAVPVYSVENTLVIWDPSIHDEDTSSITQGPTFTHVLPVKHIHPCDPPEDNLVCD